MYGGIDLGLRGGWAIQSCRGRIERAEPTPIVGRPSNPDDYDRERMVATARLMKLRGVTLVAMEAPTTVRVPKVDRRGKRSMIVSPTATAALAGSAEAWKMALHVGGVPWVLVYARKWQRLLLKGMPGDDTKAQVCAYVRSRFPGQVVLQPGRFTTDQDGIADAVALSCFAADVSRAQDNATLRTLHTYLANA